MTKLRLSATAVLSLAMGLLLLAADPPPNPVGYPKKGDPGGGIGAVRIWHADGAYHLRTSTEDSAGTKQKLMVFTGTVRCEEKLTSEASKLEKADKFILHKDGKGFDFHFETHGAIDQVDFTPAANGKTLKFKLLIDAKPAETHRILIGAEGVHPEKAEFSLPAQVKK